MYRPHNRQTLIFGEDLTLEMVRAFSEETRSLRRAYHAMENAIAVTVALRLVAKRAARKRRRSP